MPEPIIVPDATVLTKDQQAIAATGQSFDIYEWNGSGPDYLHVHYVEDEAWHVLEGTLTFRFQDKQVNAPLVRLCLFLPEFHTLILMRTARRVI